MYYYTYEEVKQLRDLRVKSKAHPSTRCSKAFIRVNVFPLFKFDIYLNCLIGALVWLARVLQKLRFINQQECTPLFRQLCKPRRTALSYTTLSCQSGFFTSKSILCIQG
jgi:hypothetical protein